MFINKSGRSMQNGGVVCSKIYQIDQCRMVVRQSVLKIDQVDQCRIVLMQSVLKIDQVGRCKMMVRSVLKTDCDGSDWQAKPCVVASMPMQYFIYYFRVFKFLISVSHILNTKQINNEDGKIYIYTIYIYYIDLYIYIFFLSQLIHLRQKCK